MKALLKLLRCEFAKLKRKPLFFAAAAISALIPLGCALFLPEMQDFASGAEAVDRLMSTLFQLSAYLLLMPAVVVLASNLLFEEQDNDTLKNLMTIPVSKPALALAKMTLLFLFSIAFMAIGGLVNLGIVLASGLEPAGFWRLFFVGIGQGILMWAGALPCVLLVVLLNRSYIISVIITFFYTVINYILGTNDFFYHAAVWIQSGYAAARTAGFPLVLPVSGHIRRTDDGIDGADQSLLCDNAPGVPGRSPGVGSVPDIDRAGL